MEGDGQRGNWRVAQQPTRQHAPDTRKWPPPKLGSCSTTKLPTTRFSPTNDSGHGKSNTGCRQLAAKMSDMGMHCCSDAHHAQSALAAHAVQLAENSLHTGTTATPSGGRKGQQHGERKVQGSGKHEQRGAPGQVTGSANHDGHGVPSVGP